MLVRKVTEVRNLMDKFFDIWIMRNVDVLTGTNQIAPQATGHSLCDDESLSYLVLIQGHPVGSLLMASHYL